MEARGERVELEQLLRDQEIRDQRDAVRDLAPMKPAADAVLLDSTGLIRSKSLRRWRQSSAVACPTVAEG